MLYINNTLTKKREKFVSQVENEVTLYTCGPTVYNYLHVGNWVAYIRWDILVRTLKILGYTPRRVMNITDVGHLVSDGDEGEDKLEKGARREGKNAWEVAEFYTNDFLRGMKDLNLVTPDFITKATEHITEQIELIKKLEEKGFTYSISDGVYYDTSLFPAYADFAGLRLDDLQEGARVEVNSEKRHPSDFALWKRSPEGSQRDMEWESPWGVGFPGWHLECSAMAMKYLGNTLDIHTGGIDHIPVHHTNEIAQSEAATGQRFANYWLHNNFLLVGGTKISKSLGNGYTLQDIIKKGYSPMDFRMFILQSHYATESNFTWENLSAAKNRLKRWKDVASLRWQMHDTLDDDDTKKAVDEFHTHNTILAALQDDLDTPAALRAVELYFTELEHTPIDTINHSRFVQLFQFIDEALGLNLLDTTPDVDDTIKSLILKRQRAREEHNWAVSDTIRDELKKRAIHIDDTPSGPIWSRL